MRLWVDDIRNAPDESWTVARTVSSAIRALAMFEPEEVSLDHDISHQVTVGALGRPYPCDETFQPVAHYIALKYELSNTAVQGQTELTHGWKPRITLHTSNPVGATEMNAILSVVGIVPEIKMMGLANRLEAEV